MQRAYLSNQVFEAVPWNLGVTVVERLCQVSLQYVHAHLKIRVVEVIRYIPADLSVFPAFLDNGVEETESEDERGKGGMWTFRQRRRIYLEVSVPHVQTEAVRRFCYDLKDQRNTSHSVVLLLRSYCAYLLDLQI